MIAMLNTCEKIRALGGVDDDSSLGDESTSSGETTHHTMMARMNILNSDGSIDVHAHTEYIALMGTVHQEACVVSDSGADARVIGEGWYITCWNDYSR